MKNILKSLLGFVLLIFNMSACDKDEATPNQAPEAFTIASNVIGNSATINWTAAIDPEGGDITYNVLREGQVVASTITTTNYTFNDLAYATTFTGKVVAYDDEGLTSETVYSFETEMRPNTAPTASVLTTPSVNEQSVTLTPELIWEASIDAENDAIVYDVYLDVASNPATKIAENLNATSYQLTTQLVSQTQYYWKVVAKDDFDGETESIVGSFTTRDLVATTLVTNEPGFADRAGHTSVVFDNKMWVIGGETCCGGRYNDVWYSEDGENWTEATADAGFGARTGSTSVVFDNKIWVVGGNSRYSPGGGYNDIWNSADGIVWSQVQNHTDIKPRYGHQMVIFDNKMWILGGRDGKNSYSSSEVWSSNDGITWSQVSDNTGINFNLSQFTVFNNKMWRIGAYSDTKIYSSTDGINWIEEADNVPFGQRHNHRLTIWDNKIWLTSGSDKATNEFVELPDVWYSEDGESWSLASDNAGYVGVGGHTMLTFDEKMWILGGGGAWKSFFRTNDVWLLEF